MNLNLFAIVLVILCVCIVLMVLLMLDTVHTVKAGNVKDWYFRYGINTMCSNELCVNNESIDVSKFVKFLVHGNSMRDFGIRSGQTVFVETMDGKQAETIANYPVLVFSLEEKSFLDKLDSAYKLRKFVGYVDLKSDAQSVYNEFAERIKLTYEDFKFDYEKRKNYLKAKDPAFGNSYILSVTYDKRIKRIHCSVHVTSSVYGAVKYVA